MTTTQKAVTRKAKKQKNKTKQLFGSRDQRGTRVASPKGPTPTASYGRFSTANG